jgi:hypothetical protein
MSRTDSDLSRRDRMKVAWHEVPGKAAINRSRPVGNGMIRSAKHPMSLMILNVTDGAWMDTYTCQIKCSRQDHTVPYGTAHAFRFSRHFVPGYLHFVPSGHLRRRFLFLAFCRHNFGKHRD